MLKVLLFYISLFLINITCYGQALSAAEKQLTEIIDSKNDQALELLKRVVNINSGTMNFAGVKKVADIFAEELNALGFKTRWIDGSKFNRSGHLIAEHGGAGKHLLLIGHLDTVFEPDSPFQSYELIADQRMRGPGICDMKGGDVIIIYALKALQGVGLLQDMHITVIMTGDEERTGDPLELARQDLIAAAKSADIAVGFENGDGNTATALISRRSASTWQLQVQGNPAHSSQIFKRNVGAGAVYEAARILNSFYSELAQEEYLTFSPGLILGGTEVSYNAGQNKGYAFGKNNVVAGRVTVSGDLRAISKQQLQKAKYKMQRIIRDNLSGTSAHLTFEDAYPPLAPTKGNKTLLSLYDAVSRDLGFGPVTAVDPTKAGAADVSFTAPYVDMAIDGLGLGGIHDHTENETADLTTLPLQTKRAAVFLYRLSEVK